MAARPSDPWKNNKRRTARTAPFLYIVPYISKPRIDSSPLPFFFLWERLGNASSSRRIVDRGTIRGKVEREEVERDSGSRW